MEEQGGFFGFLEKYIMGPMAKVASAKIVQGIMAAGVATIPFTIVGSMFLVIAVLPQTFPFLAGFFSISFDRVTPLYMVANSATMGVLALYFALALGYGYAKVLRDQEGINLDPFNGALLSMFAFLMTIPMITFEDGVAVQFDAGWSRLGTVGIFTAIVMAIIAVQLYRLCIVKNWVIKMPEEVPAGVARAFTALVPTAVIAFAIIILNGIMIALGTNLFDIVAWPFGFAVQLTDTVWGLMIVYFLVHALWLVGIHGANIILPLISPIALMNLDHNIAYVHGLLGPDARPLVWAGEFANAFVTVGGSGATLALAFWLMTRAKSTQLKVLGRASIAPGLFNINEPLIFGLPIIYNPALAIPFFLAPMASVAIGFYSVTWGISAPIIAQLPWASPVGIGAFVGTAGNLGAVATSVVCVVVAGLIWYPFIKAYDAKLLKEEQENAA